jgi:hypothetical protein
MGKSIDPRTVLSPKASIRNLNVIFDGGSWDDANPRWSGWSVATMEWDSSPGAIGVRWNGEVGEGVGNPQSRGLPTWFILPEPLAGIALECVTEHLRGGTAEALPPRRRLLDLIAFVRAASDEELTRMIDQMGLQTARAA